MTIYKLVFSIVFVIAIFLIPENYYCCSCFEIPSPQENYERSNAVFSGEILSNEIDTITSSHGWYDRIIIVKTDKVWKGFLSEIVEVRTAESEATCGVTFVVGYNYLIYAFEDENKLRCYLCERTKVIDYAWEDLQFLNSLTGILNNNMYIENQIVSLSNYPNPFNPTTNINYVITKAGKIEIKIYNSLGMQVYELVSEYKIPGNYSKMFNGSQIASGIYYCRLFIDSQLSASRKIILLK